MIDRPASVTRTLYTLTALTGVAGLVTILSAVMRRDLVLAWAEGNAGASVILREQGLDAVEETLTVPAFVPVVATGFVVLVMLLWVMGAFFKEGFTWARVCLVVFAVFGVFLAVLCIWSGIPTLFEVLAGVMVVLCVLLLFFLLHKDTSRYFREV